MNNLKNHFYEEDTKTGLSTILKYMGLNVSDEQFEIIVEKVFAKLMDLPPPAHEEPEDNIESVFNNLLIVIVHNIILESTVSRMEKTIDALESELNNHKG